MHPFTAFEARQEKMFVRLYRQDALQDQGGLCYYCDTPLTARTATADHKWPRSRHGRNSRENIAAACVDCNRAKGDMSEGQFFKAIKKPPTARTPFPIMLVWMRRKVNLKTQRACKALDRLFVPAALRLAQNGE